jgi:prevent-host-death family protein
MKTCTFSDLNRQSGEIVDAAMTEPVILTKRGKPKLVLVSYDSWRILRHGKAFTVTDAPDDVLDFVETALDEALEAI